MCGTCRYCLGFFHTAGLCSMAMFVFITFVHNLYGGMPPIYAYTAGFWLTFTANLIAIYLVALIMRSIGRGIGERWIHRYVLMVLIILVIMYLAGSICMFVPATEDRMTVFSRDYFKRRKAIPPFLDKFQNQYSCCGIKNYEDYNKLGLMNMRLPNGYFSYGMVTPLDQTWYIIETLYNVHSETSVNNTVRFHHFGFEIPRSCCSPKAEPLGKKCGKYVEYGFTKGSFNDEQRYINSANFRVNNANLGCYKKYDAILHAGRSFQLPWLIGILRWGSLLLAIMYFILVWVYNVTLRTMRKDKSGKLILDLNVNETFGDEPDSMMAAIRGRSDATPPTELSQRQIDSNLKKERRMEWQKDQDENKRKESYMKGRARPRKDDDERMMDEQEARLPESYVQDLAKIQRSRTTKWATKDLVQRLNSMKTQNEQNPSQPGKSQEP